MHVCLYAVWMSLKIYICRGKNENFMQHIKAENPIKAIKTRA